MQILFASQKKRNLFSETYSHEPLSVMGRRCVYLEVKGEGRVVPVL